MCVRVFIGISSSFSCKVRTKFPSHLSFSHSRSLFPTHDPVTKAGAEDKANNELLRQLEEVVEFFLCMQKEKQRKGKEREREGRECLDEILLELQCS